MKTPSAASVKPATTIRQGNFLLQAYRKGEEILVLVLSRGKRSAPMPSKSTLNKQRQRLIRDLKLAWTAVVRFVTSLDEAELAAA